MGDAVTSDRACRVIFRWKPTPFAEPGLSGLAGAGALGREVLADHRAVSAYLYQLAQDDGVAPASPEADRRVAAAWDQLASNPTASQPPAALVLVRLVGALSKAPAERTPPEAGLIDAMQRYIQARRTATAQDALAMYDAWKAADEALRNQRAQSQLETLFYYGTVPPDFHAAAMASLALGAGATGSLGAVASAAAFSAANPLVASFGTTGIRTSTSLVQMTRSLNAFTAAGRAAAAVAGGAAVIAIAGAILNSIAIEQFIAIVTARPKLEAAVEAARQPVDLAALLSAGPDQLAYWWSLAMRGGYPIKEVMDAAAAAATQARAAGFRIVPDTTIAWARACRDAGAARSVGGSLAALVTFKNEGSASLSVQWIDYGGARKPYATLAPGQSYAQSTYVGHPWMVADGNGACRALVQPELLEPQRSCSTEGSARSVNSTQGARVTFVNQRNDAVQLFWLDYQGQRRPYGSVAPGQSFVQPTYVGHPWLAADAQGACVGLVVPQGAQVTVPLRPTGVAQTVTVR